MSRNETIAVILVGVVLLCVFVKNAFAKDNVAPPVNPVLNPEGNAVPKSVIFQQGGGRTSMTIAGPGLFFKV